MKIIMIFILSAIYGTIYPSGVLQIITSRTAVGDTGSFNLVMKNDKTVNGMHFILNYDPFVITPIKIIPKGKSISLTGSSGELFDDNKIAFIIYDEGETFLTSDSGIIFQVDYIVSDSVYESSFTYLRFISASVADSNKAALQFEYIDGEIPIGPLVVVDDKPHVLPVKFELFQNYPNPFNPTTVIKFGIPGKSIVQLIVYDILGREVRTLQNGELEPGWYERRFDASPFASGVYLYRLQAGNSAVTRKMILMR